jgi:hypothetical protein
MNDFPISRPKLVWPIFDAIKNNAQELDPTDSILIGRYVLVKYSDKVFTHEERVAIETNGPDLTASDAEDQQAYYQNF